MLMRMASSFNQVSSEEGRKQWEGSTELNSLASPIGLLWHPLTTLRGQIRILDAIHLSLSITILTCHQHHPKYVLNPPCPLRAHDLGPLLFTSIHPLRPRLVGWFPRLALCLQFPLNAIPELS